MNMFGSGLSCFFKILHKLHGHNLSKTISLKRHQSEIAFGDASPWLGILIGQRAPHFSLAGNRRALSSLMITVCDLRAPTVHSIGKTKANYLRIGLFHYVI